MSIETMGSLGGFETPEEKASEHIPENNELPLNITSSEKLAQGSESTIHKAAVEDREGKERQFALKQIRRHAFANDEELKKSKEFYESLKNIPEFGQFVPETSFFKARVESDSEPQGFMIQHFAEGRSIDKISDDELYKDPAIVRELLDFAYAAVHMLEVARESKGHKPDLGTDFSASKRAIFMGDVLLDPRYSTNLVISDKPSANGKHVFFVDAGINVDQRLNKMTEIAQREFVGRIQDAQLKRWIKKLEGILQALEDKPGEARAANA